jgi:hypothetical protein
VEPPKKPPKKPTKKPPHINFLIINLLFLMGIILPFMWSPQRNDQSQRVQRNLQQRNLLINLLFLMDIGVNYMGG